jgi:hypothetical protein
MQNSFDGSYFDEDYFEHGRETGKSYYENYHWIPNRSFREARSFITELKLTKKDFILDFGTAKGFLVRAFRELGYYCDGCDISEYALSFAPAGCWNCSELSKFQNYSYTQVVSKDVFEHLNKELLLETLIALKNIANNITCIVPLGDNGQYRIPEYHLDPSHLIAENEEWWRSTFMGVGWEVKKELDHIDGIKDNWYSSNPIGNRVFILEKK